MSYEFDYFISYAHKDNESKDDQPGFVKLFVDKLRNSKEHQSMFGEKVSVFFDTTNIQNMTDWDIYIRSSLASSRFFVVLLSPNYFKSRYCAKEFDWWMQHEMHRRLLGEATAPMKIVTVDEIDNKVPENPTIPKELQAEFPNWMNNLQKIQSDFHFDMHDLERAKIDETLQALRQAIKNKVFKQNVAEESPINSAYPKYNENFVGRRENLRLLRLSLSSMSTTAISAVNGLGGIGKTELALTYGHAFAWDYGLGLVFANCENEDSLDNVLLSCGIAEMHDINLGDGKNQQKLTILYNELKKKIKSIEERNQENNKKENNSEENMIEKNLGTHLLLILDNVNRPELVSQDQLDKLPDFFHVIITTRESADEFSHIHTEPVDCLSEEDSVELLSNLRSFGNDEKEAAAAREIAKLLDGFTLAIELTGSYLRKKPLMTYQMQYECLKSNITDTMKSMVDKTQRLRRHQAECISAVLDSTLSELTPNACKALNYASVMSPDAVGFEWLPELVGLNGVEGIEVLEALKGYTLLTPLKREPNIARIHRLVAESLKIPEEEKKEIIAKIRAKCNNLLKKDEQFWSVPENTWNITPVSEFLKLLAVCWKVEASEEEIDWDLTRMMSTTGNILKSLDKVNEAYETIHLCYIICKERHNSFPNNKDVFQDYFSSYNSLKNFLNLFILLSKKESAAGNDIAAQEYLEKSQKISQELQDSMQEIRQILEDIKIAEVVSKKVRTYEMTYDYDYYISYARADNQSEDGQPGFVDMFVKKLMDSDKHSRMFGGKTSVFFERSKIHSMSDWDDRIRSCLNSSRFFVVLISPNYFKSEYCAREFDWWMQHEMHRRTLGEGVIPVLINPVNNVNGEIPLNLHFKFPLWGRQIEQILSSPDFDIHAFNSSQIDETVQSMNQTVKDKVIKQGLADNSPVNALYPRYNANFVGRRDELSYLRKNLSTYSSVAISLIYGLGGIGKTALALAYGHAFAWDYGLGRVFVNCANTTSLTDILLSCGIAEMNGWGLPKGTRERQLKFLFSRLKEKINGIIQRNRQEGNPETLGTHILLILDNVNQPELISREQLCKLPDFFHVIITTRESANMLCHIVTLLLDRLSEDESVELLKYLRPFGPDPREAEAARKIARLLEGFALAVELTGMYMLGRPHVTYQSHYESFVKNHSNTFQVMADRMVNTSRQAAETISAVLEPTLASLSDNAYKALLFASKMAPDAVGLGWLPELVGCNKNDDNNFLKELTSCNLLTPLAIEPNIARIHRLVAASVESEISEEERKEIIAKISAKCNDLLEEDEQFWFVPENSWNIIPVSEFLKMRANSWTVEASDKDIDWNLTRMMNSSGEILKNLGRIKDTQDFYKLLYDICLKRAETMPENVQVQLDLSASYNNLGGLEKADGNASAAQEWFEKALEINKRWADLMPDDVDVQRALIASYKNIGDLEKAVGNIAAARERSEKALEISQRLADNNPDNIDIQRDLMISYNNLGDLDKGAGNAAAALVWYKKALEIFQWLANKKQGDVGIQRNFSDIYKNFGDIEKSAGNAAAAREWYEKSLEINKRLAEIMPENVGVQEDWSVSFERLGNLENTVGNTAVARKMYEQSLEIRKWLVDKMPGNVSALWDLNALYNRLGDLEKADGNAAAAREWYKKGMEIFQYIDEMM